ncbi:hypothetical protein BHM03_00059192 [Ensete ventricosum]|nr:hypothetical protein BHM03_00059192 [Ensete ventricosum]
MWASGSTVFTAARFLAPFPRPRHRTRADVSAPSSGPAPHADSRKKVVVVGAGWAGLASAHHLCKQVRTCSFPPAGSSPWVLKKIHEDFFVLDPILASLLLVSWPQGFDVTLLESGSGPAEEIGIRGTLCLDATRFTETLLRLSNRSIHPIHSY